jgi:hypothetical protein
MVVIMYKIIEVVSKGLIRTSHSRYGKQLWALSKLTKKHKGDACAICEESIGNIAYRPITNLGNRYKRICRRHQHYPRPG